MDTLEVYSWGVITGVTLTVGVMLVIKISRDMERKRRIEVARNYFGNEDECHVEVVESDGTSITRPPERRPKTYCFANGDVVEWLRPHGPIVEASAGSGWLANRLQQAQIDVVAYDSVVKKGVYTTILQGYNGTFEHSYPDHTLLIAHGFESEASVKKYVEGGGTKVILCGYRFQELWVLGVEKTYAVGNKEYDFRPSQEFMTSLNLQLTDEIECHDPGKAGVTQVYRLFTILHHSDKTQDISL